jgi:hypothetical protein
MPGDPPQLHARRPPLQAQEGPLYARRGTFAKVGDLRPRRRGRPGGLLPFGAPASNEPPGAGFLLLQKLFYAHSDIGFDEFLAKCLCIKLSTCLPPFAST